MRTILAMLCGFGIAAPFALAASATISEDTISNPADGI
jgi:hypothetical protein